MKVAIVFGGKSTENYVSRLSATSVINNIDNNKYEPILIGITKEGKWLHYTGSIEDIVKDDWYTHVEINPLTNKPVSGFERMDQEDIDVIFPVLHGTNGEDGTVQGFFELLDKPYVGCGVLASAVSLDKAYTKIICERENIPQCKYLVLARQEIQADVSKCTDLIESKFDYPIFIKPSNAGSSVGINKASDRASLINALKTASEYDFRVIIEEFVDGREIECAVLGNYDAQVAVPGEVIAANEFYDYEAKYFNEASKTEVPANITETQKQEVMDYSKRIFRALDCKGLSRVDFFLERNTGKFIFNEINTLPGFTNISMYSKMWAACGISYPELLDKLIDLAFDNHEACKRKYTV